MIDQTFALPGRLGNQDLLLINDPRADPRLVAAVTPTDPAYVPPPLPVDASSPLADIRQFLGAMEAASGEMLSNQVDDLPPVEGVERSIEVIRGVDDNDITLFIHRPVENRGPTPAVLHLHGGGGVMLSAADPGYSRWRDELAAAGLIVIGVEFRNGAGKLGPHPFPAGLNDCSSGLDWVSRNRELLGISKLIVSGDSGGGNLALATTLKAKRDGLLDQIDGVYALCPYISNNYEAESPELPSLYENNHVFVSVLLMAIFAKAYVVGPDDSKNPLAWPYHAELEDLEGLPPHVISVNELDILRDEGLAYYRKLMAAGVPATSRTVNGIFHAAENNFYPVIPDVARATILDIAGFARSL